MMISSTGNGLGSVFRRSRRRERGFSFVEVMVTMVVMSLGVVMIYKAFFTSLNFINHVTYRLVALSLLDKRIADTEWLLKSQGVISLTQGARTESVVIHNKPVDFHFQTDFRNVGMLKGVYELELSLSWREGERDITVSRAVYIAG